MNYDGFFELENGEIIKYIVNPDFHSCKYEHGELVKASRYIYFFDALGKSLGFYPYYTEIESLTTITSCDAHKVYLEKCAHK